MSDNETLVTELLSAQIASLNTENGALRAEIDRLRARCRELDDEAFDYAEQIEQLKAEINRQRAILAALREPSETVLMGAHQQLRGIFPGYLVPVIRAAVAAAEQEVGRE